MLRINRGLVATVAALVLFSASPAFAQDSSNDGYNDFGGRVESNVQGDTAGSGGSGGSGGAEQSGVAGTTNADQGGGLPFTGLDLGLLAAGGVMLLGVGLGVRRLATDSR